jgi:TPR repeat protein
MKPINLLSFLSLLFLLAPSSGNAAGSMLRITCDGDDVGAEVLVNGEFRGDCPIDLQVPKGSLKLLVRKEVDGGRERVFEQDIRMGEGSVKKVEARLGVAKISATEEARKAEIIRQLNAMSFTALQKVATEGNKEAMYELAIRYKDGAPKNAGMYAEWLRKAAEAGNVQAMTKLYAELNLGRDIQKDTAQSLFWLRKAAEAGSTRAMIMLAERYEIGFELSENKEEAFRWYHRAAELGDPESMGNVAKCYYFGRGVSKSNEEAVVWWRKGANADSKSAMFWLGRSYVKGEGVQISEEQAIYWWRKAVEGDSPNKLAVEELKKRGL